MYVSMLDLTLKLKHFSSHFSKNIGYETISIEIILHSEENSSQSSFKNTINSEPIVSIVYFCLHLNLKL